MSEAWYKECCPKCETINWICNGDESDLSSVDIQGYKCRECGKITYIGGDEMYEWEAEQSHWESEEDCIWELGKETPT